MTLTLASTPGHVAHDDYTAFCGGLRLLVKVDLLQYRRSQMERRVRSLADRRGHPDLPGYLAELRGNPAEREHFLDRITPSPSLLWRDPEDWALLSSTVLPALAAKSSSLRAWSAGCASGAEAYTLAAMARAALPGVKVEVSGTDIDPRLVGRANLGCFSEGDVRHAPADELRRCFEASPGGGWRAKSSLRTQTRFEVGDLLRLRPRTDAYDLVMCRHTAGGFDDGVQAALFARLTQAIRPGGYLVVGGEQRVPDADALGLVATGGCVYRKG